MTVSSENPRGSLHAARPQQLVRVAARKSGLPEELVSEAFEALVSAVCDTLLRGQPVKLGPVGTLRPVLARAGQPNLAISPGSELLQEAERAQSHRIPAPPPIPAAPSRPGAPSTASYRPRRGLRLTLLTLAQARRLLERVQHKSRDICPRRADHADAQDRMFARFPRLVSPPRSALLLMQDVRGVKAGSFTVVAARPQSYTKAVTLRRTSEVLDYFYSLTDRPGEAVSDGSGDEWWVLNDSLVRYLRKLDKALNWARTQCAPLGDKPTIGSAHA